ncbi:MAG: 30S ribosome-binding factor RbfA [Desulfosoma sp.]|uniref:30S ribosome-binding factor RbfA n=1 Tax=Desulfosoma sp. TaxID=2603217 RepID=UPI004049B30E
MWAKMFPEGDDGQTMQYKRADRVADLLQRTVAEILLRRVRDPRLGKLTVTSVEVSADLRYAKIYYCFVGSEKERPQVAQALEKARPFIRREIGRRVELRYVPDIQFFFDASFDYGEKIERLLHRIHEES